MSEDISLDVDIYLPIKGAILKQALIQTVAAVMTQVMLQNIPADHWIGDTWSVKPLEDAPLCRVCQSMDNT